MIKVRVQRNNGNIVSVVLKGHSGYAESGSDIICSAATAISTSIGDGIVEILKVKANCIAVEGHIKIDLKSNSKEDIEKCQPLMETMALGLKSIEMMHDSYIRVLEEEV